jgi:hypothetical protein
MAHHEAHDDHGHDNTEGNRQYYPQGWHLPLVGLFVVAFFFAVGGGLLLGISGTDKWGHKEVCHEANCDGHCGMDHEKACCTDGSCDHCKAHAEGEHSHEDGEHAHTDGATTDHNQDSTAVAMPTADSGKTDSTKPAEAGHEGHSH